MTGEEHTFYFGPAEGDYSRNRRKFTGIPSLAATPGGRLWATWYAGPTPGEDVNNYVVLATSADGGETWKEVYALKPAGCCGRIRAFDPNLWVTDAGTLQWNWSIRIPDMGGREGCNGDMVYAAYGLDPESESMEWTKPIPVAPGVAMGKTISLSTGEWAMPVSRWFDEVSARVYVSKDGGRSWSMRGGARVAANARIFDEHVIVEMGGGRMDCYIRTAIGIAVSHSSDMGASWTDAALSWIPHTNSRFFVKKLQSGNLLLVKNGPYIAEWSISGRNRMMAFISRDGGNSWEGGLMLDERDEVSYPDGDQGSDGTIYITYDRSRYGEKEILLAAFREEDVLSGNAQSPSCRLGRIISKGTDGN